MSVTSVDATSAHHPGGRRQPPEPRGRRGAPGRRRLRGHPGRGGRRGAGAARRRGGPIWCCSTCSCRGWTATRPAGASARCPRAATCRSSSSPRSAISRRTRRRSNRAPTTFSPSRINRTELLIRVRSLLRIKRLSDELRAQRPGDPDAAGRAAGGAAAEGRADGADRPRSQEPAVEHPLQRPVRAGAGDAAGRRARVAGRRGARVAVDGPPGDEPARREPQRRRRAHPARLRVRAAGAARRGLLRDGAPDRGQGAAAGARRWRPAWGACAAIAIWCGGSSRT